MISRTSNNISPDFTAGEVVMIDKPAGITSFGVVSRIRKHANVKKVGHAGTLDPVATGLLIICTGKKTKEIYKYQDDHKEYTGVFELGKVTPSYDSETEVTEEKDFSAITDTEIYNAREKLTGEIEQVPPMYSALKHKGKALYKLARKGVEVERAPRKVTIHEFEISKIELPFVHFLIKCTKGTYIRTIANDFGELLGCGAYLKELRRTAIGVYRVEDALLIEEFIERHSTLESN